MLCLRSGFGSRPERPAGRDTCPAPPAFPDVLCRPAYQSLPRTSPPAGVQAAHQVVALTPDPRKRTLPSPRATLMPAVWGEEATALSHGPGLLRGFMGCTRNIEAVPVLKTVPSMPLPP